MNIDTKITPRLKTVANLVPKCFMVADVGTDHGYLPIYLVKKGICERAVASDVNEGPINAARKNIALAELGDVIETRLSDGLKNIDCADCVTISGMGGELMASILKGRKEGMTRFVLQPQRSYDVLRQYLAENGFEIKKEAVCRENDKMYSAFYAEYTKKAYKITKKDALIGKKELFDDEKMYEEYVSYRRKEVEKVLWQMEKANAIGEKYEEMKELEKMLR